MFYGPLLELPWARRQPIMRAVKAGSIVEDPGDAPYAARFAHRQARRFLIAAVVCAAVTALTIAELLVDACDSERSMVPPASCVAEAALSPFDEPAG